MNAQRLALPLQDCRFAAIDFESAGIQPGASEAPVQIGIAVMQGLQFQPEDSFRSYLRCDQEITWSAAKVHGITKDDLQSAPTIMSIWPDVRKRLEGAVIVAHGAGTEKRFLRVFPTHSFGPWLDTVSLSRRCYPDAKSHRLGDLIQAMSLEEEMASECPEWKWHDALYDSIASLSLLRYLILQMGWQEKLLSELV
ncbi:MAG: 3'-5' exonuclease [Verrucomicrobiota bacterium]